MSTRPACLLRIEQRTAHTQARIRAGVKLLEALLYVAAIWIGLALSATWPMGFAAP